MLFFSLKVPVMFCKKVTNILANCERLGSATLKGQCHEILDPLFVKTNLTKATSYEQAKAISRIISFSNRYSLKSCVRIVIDNAGRVFT